MKKKPPAAASQHSRWHQSVQSWLAALSQPFNADAIKKMTGVAAAFCTQAAFSSAPTTADEDEYPAAALSPKILLQRQQQTLQLMVRFAHTSDQIDHLLNLLTEIRIPANLPVGANTNQTVAALQTSDKALSEWLTQQAKTDPAYSYLIARLERREQADKLLIAIDGEWTKPTKDDDPKTIADPDFKDKVPGLAELLGSSPADQALMFHEIVTLMEHQPIEDNNDDDDDDDDDDNEAATANRIRLRAFACLVDAYMTYPTLAAQRQHVLNLASPRVLHAFLNYQTGIVLASDVALRGLENKYDEQRKRLKDADEIVSEANQDDTSPQVTDARTTITNAQARLAEIRTEYQATKKQLETAFKHRNALLGALPERQRVLLPRSLFHTSEAAYRAGLEDPQQSGITVPEDSSLLEIYHTSSLECLLGNTKLALQQLASLPAEEQARLYNTEAPALQFQPHSDSEEALQQAAQQRRLALQLSLMPQLKAKIINDRYPHTTENRTEDFTTYLKRLAADIATVAKPSTERTISQDQHLTELTNIISQLTVPVWLCGQPETDDNPATEAPPFPAGTLPEYLTFWDDLAERLAEHPEAYATIVASATHLAVTQRAPSGDNLDPVGVKPYKDGAPAITAKQQIDRLELHPNAPAAKAKFKTIAKQHNKLELAASVEPDAHDLELLIKSDQSMAEKATQLVDALKKGADATQEEKQTDTPASDEVKAARVTFDKLCAEFAKFSRTRQGDDDGAVPVLTAFEATHRRKVTVVEVTTADDDDPAPKPNERDGTINCLSDSLDPRHCYADLGCETFAALNTTFAIIANQTSSMTALIQLLLATAPRATTTEDRLFCPKLATEFDASEDKQQAFADSAQAGYLFFALLHLQQPELRKAYARLLATLKDKDASLEENSANKALIAALAGFSEGYPDPKNEVDLSADASEEETAAHMTKQATLWLTQQAYKNALRTYLCTTMAKIHAKEALSPGSAYAEALHLVELLKDLQRSPFSWPKAAIADCLSILDFNDRAVLLKQLHGELSETSNALRKASSELAELSNAATSVKQSKSAEVQKLEAALADAARYLVPLLLTPSRRDDEGKNPEQTTGPLAGTALLAGDPSAIPASILSIDEQQLYHTLATLPPAALTAFITAMREQEVDHVHHHYLSEATITLLLAQCQQVNPKTIRLAQHLVQYDVLTHPDQTDTSDPTKRGATRTALDSNALFERLMLIPNPIVRAAVLSDSANLERAQAWPAPTELQPLTDYKWPDISDPKQNEKAAKTPSKLPKAISDYLVTLLPAAPPTPQRSADSVVVYDEPTTFTAQQAAKLARFIASFAKFSGLCTAVFEHSFNGLSSAQDRSALIHALFVDEQSAAYFPMQGENDEETLELQKKLQLRFRTYLFEAESKPTSLSTKTRTEMRELLLKPPLALTIDESEDPESSDETLFAEVEHEQEVTTYTNFIASLCTPDAVKAKLIKQLTTANAKHAKVAGQHVAAILASPGLAGGVSSTSGTLDGTGAANDDVVVIPPRLRLRLEGDILLALLNDGRIPPDVAAAALFSARVDDYRLAVTPLLTDEQWLTIPQARRQAIIAAGYKTLGGSPSPEKVFKALLLGGIKQKDDDLPVGQTLLPQAAIADFLRYQAKKNPPLFHRMLLKAWELSDYGDHTIAATRFYNGALDSLTPPPSPSSSRPLQAGQQRSVADDEAAANQLVLLLSNSKLGNQPSDKATKYGLTMAWLTQGTSPRATTAYEMEKDPSQTDRYTDFCENKQKTIVCQRVVALLKALESPPAQPQLKKDILEHLKECGWLTALAENVQACTLSEQELKYQDENKAPPYLLSTTDFVDFLEQIEDTPWALAHVLIANIEATDYAIIDPPNHALRYLLALDIKTGEPLKGNALAKRNRHLGALFADSAVHAADKQLLIEKLFTTEADDIPQTEATQELKDKITNATDTIKHIVTHLKAIVDAALTPTPTKVSSNRAWLSKLSNSSPNTKAERLKNEPMRDMLAKFITPAIETVFEEIAPSLNDIKTRKKMSDELSVAINDAGWNTLHEALFDEHGNLRMDTELTPATTPPTQTIADMVDETRAYMSLSLTSLTNAQDSDDDEEDEILTLAVDGVYDTVGPIAPGDGHTTTTTDESDDDTQGQYMEVKSDTDRNQTTEEEEQAALGGSHDKFSQGSADPNQTTSTQTTDDYLQISDTAETTTDDAAALLNKQLQPPKLILEILHAKVQDFIAVMLPSSPGETGQADQTSLRNDSNSEGAPISRNQDRTALNNSKAKKPSAAVKDKFFQYTEVQIIAAKEFAAYINNDIAPLIAKDETLLAKFVSMLNNEPASTAPDSSAEGKQNILRRLGTNNGDSADEFTDDDEASNVIKLGLGPLEALVIIRALCPPKAPTDAKDKAAPTGDAQAPVQLIFDALTKKLSLETKDKFRECVPLSNNTVNDLLISLQKTNGQDAEALKELQAALQTEKSTDMMELLQVTQVFKMAFNPFHQLIQDEMCKPATNPAVTLSDSDNAAPRSRSKSSADQPGFFGSNDGSARSRSASAPLSPTKQNQGKSDQKQNQGKSDQSSSAEDARQRPRNGSGSNL